MRDGSEQSPAGLYIFPDAFSGAPMSSLQSLREHITSCDVGFAPDGSILTKDLEDILGESGGQRLVNVYDRSPSVDGWYYSLYALPTNSSNTRTVYASSPNIIANAVMPRGSPCVKGPVLVVLDGPADGVWGIREAIDEDRFARTVWWYFKSGNDVSQVYGEREFQRFLKGYV